MVTPSAEWFTQVPAEVDFKTDKTPPDVFTSLTMKGNQPPSDKDKNNTEAAYEKSVGVDPKMCKIK